MPPLRLTEFTEHMFGAAKKLGWAPFPGGALIISVAYGGRSAYVYHGYCTRGGCHVHAKNGPHITTIPRAQETKRLTVVTRAHVTKIEVDDKTGRVTGATYLKDGIEYFQPADAVLLASYTCENVRLLLLSKLKALPHGIANNNGQVGRHYIGGNLFVYSDRRPIDAANMPTFGRPAWGSAWKAFVKQNADR